MIAKLDPTRCRRGDIPATRDPFVNTPLISLGTDAAGTERFWTSTWNNHLGCQAAIVDTLGQSRQITFSGERFSPGFYSAALESDSVLWLCCWLSEVVRFDLANDTFERYETGARGGLMFQGMAYDPPTGKLFAIAHPPPLATAFIFDTRQRQPIRLIEDVCPDKYERHSWRDSDGIWHAVMTTPGVSIVHWNPQTDEISHDRLTDTYDAHGKARYQHLLQLDNRVYLPLHGWWGSDGLEDGPRPDEEAHWMGELHGGVYGVQRPNTDGQIVRWDLATGDVEPLFSVPDTVATSFCLTQKGQLASVSLYGEYRLFDLPNGCLINNCRLAADAVQHVDHIRRVTEDRVLGTPFISQRFWETDLATGATMDCGRAAPGSGQITRTWRLGGKTWLASYTTGSLMEYDPRRPARFPENPRVVATPPHGMRPVASTDDGRTLWYSSNAPYGQLGCVLTAYDTETATARYAEHPIPDQAINQLWHLQAADRLLASTTINADQGSAPARASVGSFALIEATTLDLIQRVDGPAEAVTCRVHGPLGDGRWLASGGRHDNSQIPLILDEALQQTPLTAELPVRLPLYTGQPGWFLAQIDGRTELWDMRTVERREVLYQSDEPYQIRLADGDLFLVFKTHFELYSDVFSGL